MSKTRDFKKLVRQRMRKTGESFTTARAILLRVKAEAAQHAGSVTGKDSSSKAAFTDHPPAEQFQPLAEQIQLAKRAAEPYLIDLVQFIQFAKQAAQPHLADLVQFTELAERAAEPYLVDLVQFIQLAKQAAEPHLADLVQFAEFAKQAADNRPLRL